MSGPGQVAQRHYLVDRLALDLRPWMNRLDAAMQATMARSAPVARERAAAIIAACELMQRPQIQSSKLPSQT